MKEHLKGHVKVDDLKLQNQDVHMHFFSQHDFDKNNKLDGTELVKTLIEHAEGKTEFVIVVFTVARPYFSTRVELYIVLQSTSVNSLFKGS